MPHVNGSGDACLDLFHEVGRLVSFQVSDVRPSYETAPSCLFPLTGHIPVQVLKRVLSSWHISGPPSRSCWPWWPSCLFPLTGHIPVQVLKRVLYSWHISGPPSRGLLELTHYFSHSSRSCCPWWPSWPWFVRFWAHWFVLLYLSGDGLFQHLLNRWLLLEALLHLGPQPFWFRCRELVFQAFQPFF